MKLDKLRDALQEAEKALSNGAVKQMKINEAYLDSIRKGDADPDVLKSDEAKAYLDAYNALHVAEKEELDRRRA